MDTKNYATAQGHWILARMGKKVLRPGGRILTEKLVNALDIQPEDDIVEFAPGMGFTAHRTLAKRPKSYIGIDADEDVIKLLSKKFKGENYKFMLSRAEDTEIPSESKDIVYGEAMLTMHADQMKSRIIHEAHRILKKGGIYAIHELGLRDVDKTMISTIQRDLTQAIRVNARPILIDEWKRLLKEEGFVVRETITRDMKLLNPRRLVQDEGLFTAMKVGFNVLTHPAARKRVVGIRRSFMKYRDNLNAFAMIAEKK